MSFFVHSAEVRWFFQGQLPEAFLAWFTAGKAIMPAERIDAYLLLPGCATVGVKQREGRFEIKALCEAARHISFGDGITGCSDTWVKWSYGGQGIEAFITGLNQEPESWLPITKKRWLRKFSLDSPLPEEVGPMDQPQEGCGIELTAITVNDSRWWTFGLEGFGALPNVQRNLHRAAADFFAAHQPPMQLAATSSTSYPAWISAFSS